MIAFSFISEAILLSIFVLSALIQIYFWMHRFRLPSDDIQTLPKDPKVPISVVICAKNELENLRITIPSILAQQYPHFELIVCDDNSTDNSLDYLNSVENERLKVLSTGKETPGKKYALEMAVNHAKNDWVLVTDADCKPSSESWVQLMSEKINSGTKLVLGYGPFNPKPSLLNKFERYECLFTAIQYFSSAIIGQPYMGVGRNMLFHRDVFSNRDKLSGAHLASGDDDLMVNRNNISLNPAWVLNENTFMYSEAKSSWNLFFTQKKRHISTSWYYTPSSKFFLISYPLTLILYYTTFILLLFTGFAPIVLFIFLYRSIIYLIRHVSWQNQLKEIDLKPFTLIFDFTLVIYYFIMFPFLFIKNGSKW